MPLVEVIISGDIGGYYLNSCAKQKQKMKSERRECTIINQITPGTGLLCGEIKFMEIIIEH